MPDRSRKRRPRDPNQLGKFIVDIATGDVEDKPESILQELVSLKLKAQCEIEPTMTFDEFMAYIDARKSMPAMPILGNREFIVRRVQ
jgi:hypothetical protein